MIKSDEAEELLLSMLNGAKFDFSNPDVKLAWNIFKKFFKQEVDCADDVLLFQCGVNKIAGEDLFNFEFVRQFMIEIDEEYDHMEQLKLKTYFKPCRELDGLKISLWLYDCDSAEDFFHKVENMDNFKIPVQRFAPIRSEIEHKSI